MSFSNAIAKYVLYYWTKRANDSDVVARIRFYSASNQLVGYVTFYKDGQAIPDNRSDETTDPKLALLTMHEHQLARVVDMLRNEKPCSVFYHNPTYAIIYSGLEPVGEEETEV